MKTKQTETGTDSVIREVRDSIARRARRGSRAHFQQMLDSVPDRPPLPGDEL